MTLSTATDKLPCKTPVGTFHSFLRSEASYLSSIKLVVPHTCKAPLQRQDKLFKYQYHRFLYHRVWLNVLLRCFWLLMNGDRLL